MGMTVADICRRKQAERLKGLHQQASSLLAQQPGGSLWLFDYWARGDWDGFSDVDVLAVAPNHSQASVLADAVLDLGMADDVLSLTEQEWQERRNSDDPYWRAIGRDAMRLRLLCHHSSTPGCGRPTAIGPSQNSRPNKVFTARSLPLRPGIGEGTEGLVDFPGLPAALHPLSGPPGCPA